MITDAPLNASRSVLLFGALEANAGTRSPFARKQLLAVAKPTLPLGGSVKIVFAICAADLLDDGLGADRQPVPNNLHLWVGDAMVRERAALVALDDKELAPERDR